MKPILHTVLPAALTPLINAPLPGTRPVAADEWLLMDEVYARQMALRDSLLSQRETDVYRIGAAALPAAEEVAQSVADWVLRQPGFTKVPQGIRRPDGVEVLATPDQPLLFAGRLVQEDLCILQPTDGQHLLTGAVLCFPAAWSLAQKFMRPLLDLHRTVARYDDGIARRVQRLFDGLQPGRPLLRVNGGLYETAELYAPRLEGDPRPPAPADAPFARSERQCLVRLPQTGAVLFTIHTFVVQSAVLTPAQRQRFTEE